jgi:hypothetical protein
MRALQSRRLQGLNDQAAQQQEDQELWLRGADSANSRCLIAC